MLQNLMPCTQNKNNIGIVFTDLLTLYRNMKFMISDNLGIFPIAVPLAT